jgi:8-oxo-dGTP pyrophosphatase MutT (NUDIX family)
LSHAERRIDLDRILRALRSAPPPQAIEHEPDPRRPSAVLVPIFEEDGEAWLLLTRRAQHLRNHRGEVSFPGGRQDDGEALIDTATREANEEIGLDPATVEIVGELDHLVTFTSKAAIVPYVGVLPARPIDLTPNPDEVELVLTLPFSELLHEDTFREELWHFFDAE